MQKTTAVAMEYQEENNMKKGYAYKLDDSGLNPYLKK
jgi:hypothetical protein